MLFLRAIFIFVIFWKSSECAVQQEASAKTVNLAYSCIRVKGEGTAPDQAPIVLVHGLAMSKEDWMGIYQVLALKTRRRVCAPDLRNHGDSPWNDQTDVNIMAEDVVKLFDKLEAQKVILIGHSLGGKIVMHIALKYPEKVEKLIVEDMRPNGITRRALLEINVLMNILRNSIKAVPKGADESTAKKAIVDYINKQLKRYRSDFRMDEKATEHLPIRCAVGGTCQWKANMQLLRKVQKTPLKFLTPSTGLYKGPVLFIYGTKSPFKLNEDEKNIRKLFPNAKLVGIQGANHVIHSLYPEFLQEVLKFFNQTESFST